MSGRKGIILAGGSGTRLHPMTRVVSKQMMPIYDKPMIFYPLTTLMLAGIRDILIISTPDDTPLFRSLLGSGEQWGLRLSYAVQPRAEGLAQAYIIGADFVEGGPSALVLGDNIFHGHRFSELLIRANAASSGCSLFAYHVPDPHRFGIVEFDDAYNAISLEEKPERPRSHYAVTGLYFYDDQAPLMVRDLRPSSRGELEITDLNRMYLKAGTAKVHILGRGYAWLDTGTPDSLLRAGQFIATVQQTQGLMIACPEEIAFNAGWIDAEQLLGLAAAMRNSTYGQYLRALVEQRGSPAVEAG